MMVCVAYIISMWNDTLIYAKKNPWFNIFFKICECISLISGAKILGRDIAVESKVRKQSQTEDVLAFSGAFSLDVLSKVPSNSNYAVIMWMYKSAKISLSQTSREWLALRTLLSGKK